MVHLHVKMVLFFKKNQLINFVCSNGVTFRGYRNLVKKRLRTEGNTRENIIAKSQKRAVILHFTNNYIFCNKFIKYFAIYQFHFEFGKVRRGYHK